MEHFLTYFAAHEGHHRGQLLMIARQLGQRLPLRVTAGVWQWTRFSRERSNGPPRTSLEKLMYPPGSALSDRLRVLVPLALDRRRSAAVQRVREGRGRGRRG